MRLPDVETVAKAGGLEVAAVQAVYDAIAKVIAPEPVTPDAEAWVLPEYKPSYPRFTGVRATDA